MKITHSSCKNDRCHLQHKILRGLSININAILALFGTALAEHADIALMKLNSQRSEDLWGPRKGNLTNIVIIYWKSLCTNFHSETRNSWAERSSGHVQYSTCLWIWEKCIQETHHYNFRLECTGSQYEPALFPQDNIDKMEHQSVQHWTLALIRVTSIRVFHRKIMKK